MIIQLIFIDMVHNLIIFKRSAEHFFSNNAVFLLVAAIGLPQPTIAVTNPDAAFPCVVFFFGLRIFPIPNIKTRPAA